MGDKDDKGALRRAAVTRRDYIADRRQYLSDGRRNPTSGGWMVLRWDERRGIYVEGPCYRTKREALAVLRGEP